MGWLSRAKPRDTSALFAVLKSGSYQDFDAAYDSTWVHYDGYSEATLLTLAAGNTEPASRIAIVQRLLDDGADVAQGTPLHSLVGANKHDFTAEAPVLERMLDAGADINQVDPRFGTPLETAAAKFKFSDSDLEPFYNVFLSRNDLDLLAPGLGDRPVLVNLRKWYAKRALLVERAEDLLRSRNIPVPEPER